LLAVVLCFFCFAVFVTLCFNAVFQFCVLRLCVSVLFQRCVLTLCFCFLVLLHILAKRQRQTQGV
jgi:hypothetical protein